MGRRGGGKIDQTSPKRKLLLIPAIRTKKTLMGEIKISNEYKYCCDYLRSVITEKDIYLNKKKDLFYIEKNFSNSAAFLIKFCPWCGSCLATKEVKHGEIILETKNQLVLQKLEEKISENLRREILRKNYEHLKRLDYFGFTDLLTVHNFKFEIYWVIIEEMYRNFTIEEVTKKISVSQEEMKSLLNYEIEKFNLEKLVIYANKLVPSLWIEVITKEEK